MHHATDSEKGAGLNLGDEIAPDKKYESVEKQERDKKYNGVEKYRPQTFGAAQHYAEFLRVTS